MRIVTLTLLLAALGYLNFVRYETPIDVAPLSPRAPVNAGGSGALLASPENDQALDANQLTQVQSLARPVFNRSRRPFKPAAKPKASAKPDVAKANVKRPDFVILGISITGSQRSALMLERGSGTPEWLTVGAELEGFKLVAIEPEIVQVTKAGKSFKFDLYAQN